MASVASTSGVNQENVATWTAALRSGAYEQTDGTMVRMVDNRDADSRLTYCCMGVAAVEAGATVSVYREGLDEDGAFYEAYCQDGADMPGRVTRSWLGLDVDMDDSEQDIHIDWPEGLLSRSDKMPLDSITCSGLNDTLHLTFPQIADVIDYFGIK